MQECSLILLPAATLRTVKTQTWFAEKKKISLITGTLFELQNKKSVTYAGKSTNQKRVSHMTHPVTTQGITTCPLVVSIVQVMADCA